MAAEESSGTHQQLNLDHFSFEKLLAAAWVLQCVQDQMHAPNGRRVEGLESVGKVNKSASATNPDPQSILQLSAAATQPAGRHKAPTAQRMNCAALISPLDIEQQAGDERGREAASDIQNAYSRVRRFFGGHLPTVRVNLTLRGLRAAGVATPVWLLSLVAALLFVETWHRESTHNAQASLSMPQTLAAAVTDISPSVAAVAPTKIALTTKTPGIIKKIEKTDKPARISKNYFPLAVSHKQITDPAAFFAVQQLSRYEIETLQRQAKYGDDSAAFALGMAYEVGRFVPQNCSEAARWVTSAAKEGNAAAQYNLGLRYRDGDGVPANPALSANWLRKAAAHKKKHSSLASKLFASR
jgi:Sel1 repeat